jgi:hypothetical protein
MNREVFRVYRFELREAGYSGRWLGPWGKSPLEEINVVLIGLWLVLLIEGGYKKCKHGP